MSKTQEERVDFALSELLERTVPFYPDDDQETADNRLDEAYNIARDILGRQEEQKRH
jgi:gamma-tubulin complex component 3